MRIPRIPAALLCVSLIASPASADRGGRPSRPNLPSNIGDRTDHDGDYGGSYDVPPVVIVQDPKLEAERRERQKKAAEDTRKKALAGHNDPMGGFFEGKDAKNIFDE